MRKGLCSEATYCTNYVTKWFGFGIISFFNPQSPFARVLCRVCRGLLIFTFRWPGVSPETCLSSMSMQVW